MAGVILVIIGVVVYFFGGKLNWLGRLPGDIRIEKGDFKFYFPVTTMVVLSILLSVVVQLIKKLL